MTQSSNRLLFSLFLICALQKIAECFQTQPSPIFTNIKENVRGAPLQLGEVFDSAREDHELSPNHIATLRKEVSRRKAQRVLPSHFLSPEETIGDFSEESISEICKLLREHELVEVRSISSDDKKHVRNTAETLAYYLEREMQSMVVVVQVKGFAATLYSQMEGNDDNPKKIILRTSVGQKNTWTKRAKAPRDNRGQIIRD